MLDVTVLSLIRLLDSGKLWQMKQKIGPAFGDLFCFNYLSYELRFY